MHYPNGKEMLFRFFLNSRNFLLSICKRFSYDFFLFVCTLETEVVWNNMFSSVCISLSLIPYIYIIHRTISTYIHEIFQIPLHVYSSLHSTYPKIRFENQLRPGIQQDKSSSLPICLRITSNNITS